MTAKPTAAVDAGRLALMLAELRLPTIARAWPDLAATADREGWPAARFLAALLEHELADRARRRIERHLAEARLPPGKTLDAFDFTTVPMVSRAHVMALAANDGWLEKGSHVLCFGPPGSGKSHLAAALGNALVENGFRVLFTRATDLVQRLQLARQALALEGAIAKLDKYHLLILDDLAYVHKSQAETSVLFELIAPSAGFPAAPPPEPSQLRPLRATQHADHRQSAVQAMGRRVPRSCHDGRRHRPPRPPQRHLRDERRKLPPANRAGPQGQALAMTAASGRQHHPLNIVTSNIVTSRRTARPQARGRDRAQQRRTPTLAPWSLARYRAHRRAAKPPATLISNTPADRRSRAKRWRDAVTALLAAQAEHAAWSDALPDSLRDAATGQALQEIVDLDLDDLAAIQPPRGYGRD